jgi:hypothetical protein
MTLRRLRGESGGADAQRRTASMPSWVLGLAFTFFSAFRSVTSFCRPGLSAVEGPLQGTGPLPRTGGLAPRSLSCMNPG